MKIASLKNTVITASFLVAVGHVGITLAHTLVNRALGRSAGATDVYRVTCSNLDGGGTPTFRFATRVKDNLPVAPPLVSVSTSKGGTTTNTTDTNGDGNGSYSALVFNNKGNGVYTMSVKKSKAGRELYTVNLDCQGLAPSGGFFPTHTFIQQTQNQ